jgi:hypothetical protein
MNIEKCHAFLTVCIGFNKTETIDLNTPAARQFHRHG